MKMLKQREKIQILIFPKMFNVLSFYSKGQYTIQIAVVVQCADGRSIYAMPEIIDNKGYKIQDPKKASIQIIK